jgi:hypothetical protein
MNDQTQTQPTTANVLLFSRTLTALLTIKQYFPFLTNQRKHLGVKDNISAKRAGPTAVTVAAGAARRL